MPESTTQSADWGLVFPSQVRNTVGLLCLVFATLGRARYNHRTPFQTPSFTPELCGPYRVPPRCLFFIFSAFSVPYSSSLLDSLMVSYERCVLGLRTCALSHNLT
ncbi:hypothetical protein LY76DRAFT_590147 [Colletotrichum caudatum]|nr:hypothetical protein LY76DRAFT_590147 [Colletotrichum caudatum]